MRAIRGTTFFREDLNKHEIETPFEEITYHMLAVPSLGVLLADDIVLFVDTDGKLKILKSRDGKLAETPGK